MNKTWLAAVLGILLGLGVAYAPFASVSSPPKTNLPIQAFEQQSNIVQATPHSLLNLQLLILALLVGVVVATPFFLVAKRRGQ
jgi:ABC-type antimicrobial peptide transport system permease subunit